MRKLSVTEKSKFWQFVEGSLFAAGMGAVIAVATLRITSAEHHTILLCQILGFIAWAFFAAAVYRAQLLPRLSRRRRVGANIVVQVLVFVALLSAWKYGPWQLAPRLVTTTLSGVGLLDGHAAINVGVQNQSNDDISGTVFDYRVKLIPFESLGAANADYVAMETKAAGEIFAELDKSDRFKSRPLSGEEGYNAWQSTVFSPRSDELMSDQQMVEHQEGRLTVFVGGRILYLDANGCKYQTEFCGFINRAGWSVARCHKHNTQSIKLSVPCALQ